MRSCSRLRRPALLVFAGLLALTVGALATAAAPSGKVVPGQPSVLTAADISRLSADATDRSIIIFKDQLSNLPARGATANERASAAHAAQSDVLSELTQVRAKDVHSFELVNAVSATISTAEAARLQNDSSVLAVVPDAFTRAAPVQSGLAEAPPAVLTNNPPLSVVPSIAQPICPSNPAQPLVEPEAREVMNVSQLSRSPTGRASKSGSSPTASTRTTRT